MPRDVCAISEDISPAYVTAYAYDGSRKLFRDHAYQQPDHDKQVAIKVGRYISSDPIGIYGGLNTFNYADVNPVMNIDREGKSAELTQTLTGGGTALAACLANPACAAALTLGAPVVGAVAAGVAGAYAVAWAINKAEGRYQDAKRKQSAYEYAKNYCDTPPEEGASECANLSRNIDRAEKCAALYEAWDA